ncbi:MAG: isoaspartyl peptidase/L-asparaginase family protein [Thermaurantimonas sp.]
MVRFVLLIFCLLYSLNLFSQEYTYGLVLHGGAGNMRLKNQPEKARMYINSLQAALDSGYRMLQMGFSSEEVVVAVVTLLENDSLFNAGRGAVLTHQGIAELDASLMTGHDQNAGAVCGVKQIKNPILAAQYVKNHSEHVMLSGRGAEQFAIVQGLDTVPNSYFITEEVRRKWIEASQSEKFGTVGCVALDRKGNLAAGTSTGGMMMKKFGRIGDAPIIGAGTFAKNGLIAVSCTGHGEYFIRTSAAYQIAARIEYGKQKPTKAIRETLKTIKELGGTGGVIAIDSKGNIYHEYTTEGMFRAGRNSRGDSFVKIYE